MFAATRERPASTTAAKSPAPAPASKATSNAAWSQLAQRAPAAAPASQSERYEKYQEAVAALQRFQAGAPYFLHNHVPSTHRGFFDAMYYPPKFQVTVNLRFRFKNKPLTPDLVAKGFGKADVEWTDSAKEAWRKKFLTEVSAAWTGANFTLYCTRPYWEHLRAKVVTRLVDVNHFADSPDPNSEDRRNNPARLPLEADTFAADGSLVKEGDVAPHYDVLVYKVPQGEGGLSFVQSLGRSEGRANFESDDLDFQKNETGLSRRTAVHEGGHFFGLGDAYQEHDERGKPLPAEVPAHDALAKKELGRGVPLHDDGRVMSRGEQFDLTDAVTFVEAIRKATRMPDWSLQEPKPTRPPAPPPEYNDGVPPRDTVA